MSPELLAFAESLLPYVGAGAFGLFSVLVVHLALKADLSHLHGHRTHIEVFLLLVLLAFALMAFRWSGGECTAYIASCAAYLSSSKWSEGKRNQLSQDKDDILPDPAED